MEKNKIRKEIAELINSIKEHTDNIQENERIPKLELETILNKIEQLYEKAIVLNYLHSHPEKATAKQVEESLAPKETVIEEEIEVKVVEEKEKQPEVIVKEEIKAAAPETIPTIDLFGEELPKASEKQKVEKKKEIKAEPTSTKNITKPAITDIKTAIGINDKFQFINQLFDENGTEYNIAINNFNTAESLESAMDYFNSLQQLYNWDTEDDTVKRLLDLVERRYS